jgi:hypothetical protein
MKNENDADAAMRDTTKLLEETQQIFQRSFAAYAKAVQADLQSCIEKVRKEGRTRNWPTY